MQFYQASKTSLASSGGVKITEEYIPLWFADGANASTTSTGIQYLHNGMNTTNNTMGSDVTLFTLNSNWSASTKFALEATAWIATYAGYVDLYDITSSTTVASVTVGGSVTTATVIRSSQFTLTPGHSYGVGLRAGTIGYTIYCSDASLIVFG